MRKPQNPEKEAPGGEALNFMHEFNVFDAAAHAILLIQYWIVSGRLSDLFVWEWNLGTSVNY